MLARFLRWTLHKVGGYTFLIVLLLVIILGNIAYGIAQAIPAVKFSVTFSGILISLIFSWWLARRGISWRLAVPLLIVSGIMYLVVETGNLGSPFWAFLTAVIRLSRQGWWGQLDWQPVGSALADLVTNAGSVFLITAQWLQNLIYRRAAYNPLAINLLWGFALWLCSAWAGWMIRRFRKPILGILPGSVLLAAVLNYTQTGISSLLPLFGVILLLLVAINHQQRESRWQDRRIDYSEELRFDITMTSLALTTALVIIAGITPSLSVYKFANFVSKLSGDRYSDGRYLAESLGLYPSRSGEGQSAASIASGGLPRSHLIGTGPELAEVVIMQIETSDLPPMSSPELQGIAPARYYWRGFSYNEYTGQGWNTSQTTEIQYQAGEKTGISLPPTRRQLRQKVSGAFHLGLVFAAGDLLQLDHAHQASWRIPPDGQGSGDLFGITINAQDYEAITALPQAGESDLRFAGEDYPDWVLDYYLTLPDNVPDRVIELAEELTASQTSVYDRAKAIENYLRTFPYTLDLPAPPANREISDYFLFELQKGYCDYYATTMVVLARAAGIPARLSVGYASGQYDPERARYIITAADAHSWPEIYFPHYGWIEFEPTAGQPVLEHAPPDITFSALDTSWQPREHTNQAPGSTATLIANILVRWVFPIMLIVGIGIILAVLISTWRLKRMTPLEVTQHCYRQLQRHAKNLAVPIIPSSTPHEFLSAFEHQFATLREKHPRLKALTASNNIAHQLVQSYTEATYSPHPLDDNARRGLIIAWGKTRWRLWAAEILYRMKILRESDPYNPE